MNIIVAVAKNYGIGYKNNLLFSIPTDMKYFRDTTKDKVVIMGRKTLESFPNKKPLKNRTNIVLTHSSEKIDGVIQVKSIDELMNILKNYSTNDIFVIGGESIYKQLLPFCKYAFLTEVDSVVESDSFFPIISELPEWRKIECGKEISENGVTFRFCKYENTSI